MKLRRGNMIIFIFIMVTISIIFILTTVTGKSTGARKATIYVTTIIEKESVPANLLNRLHIE